MSKAKEWSEEIKSFIKLLQLLPAPPKGTKETSQDMNATIDKFLIHSKVIFFIQK